MIIQATTPTIVYVLPFSTADVKTAEITLKYVDNNKKILITKPTELCEFDENTISTMLTQEETARLPAPADAEVQLCITTADDKVMATIVERVSIRRLLKEVEV